MSATPSSPRPRRSWAWIGPRSLSGIMTTVRVLSRRTGPSSRSGARRACTRPVKSAMICSVPVVDICLYLLFVQCRGPGRCRRSRGEEQLTPETTEVYGEAQPAHRLLGCLQIEDATHDHQVAGRRDTEKGPAMRTDRLELHVSTVPLGSLANRPILDVGERGSDQLELRDERGAAGLSRSGDFFELEVWGQDALDAIDITRVERIEKGLDG